VLTLLEKAGKTVRELTPAPERSLPVKAALLCLLAAGSMAQADTYTLAVGSYQKHGPAHAHTFAVMERAGADGRKERPLHLLDAASGRVALVANPTRGENWSEEKTYSRARELGVPILLERPSSWTRPAGSASGPALPSWIPARSSTSPSTAATGRAPINCINGR